MKLLRSLTLAATLLACASAHAQEPSNIAAARSATEQWLKLVDKEEYAAAWNVSSAGVRTDMPKFAWTMLMSATHAPLGEFKSRSFKSSNIKKPDAGKPGDESISLEYESRYESNPAVREVITTVHEKDGSWRVSGYGIHDAK